MSERRRAAARAGHAINDTNGPTSSAPFVLHAGSRAALILPHVNIYAMNLHLKEISTQVAQGAHAVVTLDGAGWHQQGDKLKVPDNISLLLLPSYSPELNPQENVWQFLRQNYLANRVYDTYTDLVDACCEA